MTINIHLPPKLQNMKPTITVVGVGGAGGNAVNNMITSSLEGVNFIVANTDAQALENSMCDKRIQLGARVTQGLGAGASPHVGSAAAEESLDEIESHVTGSNMVFITAGMGGGTGTGAAPVIAKLAKDNGILTVGVITKPFQFEGAHRMRTAESGINELQKYVDTLIVIPNQNLFRLANERTTFADAFKMADDVLHAGVRGITDLMIMPGLINLDFADIRTVMGEMGKAMMGTGEGEGERRAIDAAEAAISNPLLDDISMKGARGVLINITGGPDLTLYEVDEAANRIREEVDPEANIIFGSTFNKDMEGKLRVSVVATGIGAKEQQQQAASVFTDASKRQAMHTLQNVFSAQAQKPLPHKPEARPEQPAFADALVSEKKTSNESISDSESAYTEFTAKAAPEKQAQVEVTEQKITLPQVQQKVVISPAKNASPVAQQQKEQSLSFLQKLGLSKQSQPAKPEPAQLKQAPMQSLSLREPKPAETMEAGGNGQKTRKSAEGDVLDIPAFLRRQSGNN